MILPGARPSLSVVIPAYNEEKLLPACLASVAASAREADLAAETIVSDDASADRTAEVARQAGAKVVRSGARNIAATRNAGARAAEGAHLVFLDADSRMNGRLLSETHRLLSSGRVAGGGADIVFDDPSSPGARWMPPLWGFLARRMRWAAGSYVFCRRDAFLAIGGFDERLFMSEELDFSMKLGRWGRSRGLSFETIGGCPCVTSARKLKNYTAWELLRPGAAILARENLRDRRRCSVLYDGRR